MMSDDRSVAVVFNGAIYNFRDLRAELERAGYVFRTQTDTEVLIYGYREWGIDRLISRLRGMFAIGLWDATAQTLYLFRDRLGVNPLAYCVQDGTLAFASTVRALHRGGFGRGSEHRCRSRISGVWLCHGPARHLQRHPQSARGRPCPLRYGIRQTHGGALLALSSAVQAARAPDFEEVVAEVERRFVEAVRLRLSADVKVAALLSGGIDSGLVCWGIRRGWRRSDGIYGRRPRGSAMKPAMHR